MLQPWIRLFVVACALAPACASDPLSYSAPVGINLKAKSSDVSGSAVSDAKDITSEVGNPFGAFVTQARAKLGGHDPARIEVDNVDLVLGAQSTGVSALDQVYTGDVDIAFVMNTSSNTYDVGHVMNPIGVGPVSVDVTFSYAQLAPQDRSSFIGGMYKVVIRGPAAATFPAAHAEANLQVTLTFAAFE